MFQMLKKFTGLQSISLCKAKERKNDNNWGYHQFDGGY